LFGIGGQELLILFLVVLLLFGADRIPEVARALGKSIRDFKRAAGDIENEFQQVTRHKDLLSEGKSRKPRAGGSGAAKKEEQGVAAESGVGTTTEGGGNEDDAEEAAYGTADAPKTADAPSRDEGDNEADGGPKKT
jgi:sec-independent protein translocase protein TatA